MATALKAARVATGWSQPQAIARMRQVAASLGEDLPGAHTMRLQLCRWENGRQRPGEFYRRIFCAVYQLSAQQLGFPNPAHEAGTGAVGIDVMTALLYAAPLTLAQLREVPPARVRLYTEVALADPRTPTPAELVAGLHHARSERPAWLDHTRLGVCEATSRRAQLTAPPVPVAGRVPDWVTTGRLVGSGLAAAVFTTLTPDPTDATTDGGPDSASPPAVNGAALHPSPARPRAARGRAGEGCRRAPVHHHG